jgi:hypothetical protein
MSHRKALRAFHSGQGVRNAGLPARRTLSSSVVGPAGRMPGPARDPARAGSAAVNKVPLHRRMSSDDEPPPRHKWLERGAMPYSRINIALGKTNVELLDRIASI